MATHEAPATTAKASTFCKMCHTIPSRISPTAIQMSVGLPFNESRNYLAVLPPLRLAQDQVGRKCEAITNRPTLIQTAPISSPPSRNRRPDTSPTKTASMMSHRRNVVFITPSY